MVETYYFLGKFDYEQKKFHKFHDCPQLIDLGYGTFTGPSGFVTPDERSVVFTIAQGKRNPDEEYWSGWAHNGGMPIELSVSEDRLKVAPISEIRKYFSRCLFSGELTPETSERQVLQKKSLTENRILVTTQGDHLELIMEWEEDSYIISYDRKTKEWKAISKASGQMVSKIRNGQDFVDLGEEEIRIECFVDHSILEFYLNERKSMSLRNYSFCEGNRFYVKADSMCNVSVWEYDKNAN